MRESLLRGEAAHGGYGRSSRGEITSFVSGQSEKRVTYCTFCGTITYALLRGGYTPFRERK